MVRKTLPEERWLEIRKLARTYLGRRGCPPDMDFDDVISQMTMLEAERELKTGATEFGVASQIFMLRQAIRALGNFKQSYAGRMSPTDVRIDGTRRRDAFVDRETPEALLSASEYVMELIRPLEGSGSYADPLPYNPRRSDHQRWRNRGAVNHFVTWG